MAGVCDTCGAAAPDGAAFCQSCGSPLAPPVPPPQAEQASPAEHRVPAAAPPLVGAFPPPPPPFTPPPPVTPPPPAGTYPPGVYAPPPDTAPPGTAQPGGYLPSPGAGSPPPAYPPPAYPPATAWGSPAPYVAPQAGYGPRPIEHILAYGYRLDIGAILSEGWRLFTADIGGFIGFTFVGGVIAVLLALTIVGMLLYVPLFAGLWIVPLMMLKGRPHGFNDFFGGFKQLGELLLLGLVMGLLIILGTIAFILPGIYLGIAWTWAIGLVLDRRMGFWDAMSTSLKVVNKNFWETLLLVLVIAVINSIGSMVVVGSLITIPLSFCMLVAGYKAVFGLDPRT